MKNRLLTLDWSKWIFNTLVFAAPLAILYLLFVQANINIDGFQVTDFQPTKEVIGGMILYVINVLLDFFKKYRVAGQ